jgi:filamentous hemagglutinin family protein
MSSPPIDSRVISVLVLGYCHLTTVAQAQITADGSVPSVVTGVGNDFMITAGSQAGTNLFHSFSEFSIPTGGSANFQHGAQIQNIFTRVTGGSASTLDGLLKTSVLGGTSRANFFLLNPSGIQFGSGSRLQIGGSFLATTADRVLFPDDIQFDATNTDPPLLTINMPVGLQFGPSPGPISVHGPGHNLSGGPFSLPVSDASTPSGLPIGVSSQLAVTGGKTLALAGGNLTLNGGVISADGGQLQLGAVGIGNNNPMVPLNFSTTGFSLDFSNISNLGNISLSQQALANVSGGMISGGMVIPNSGVLQVNGATVSLRDGSVLLSQNSGATPGGAITINTDIFQADGVVDVGSINDGLYIGSGIISETLGSGTSGNIILNSRQVSLTGAAHLLTRSFSTGQGGDVQVTASEFVNLSGSFGFEDQAASNVLSLIFGSGSGGNVRVSTPRITIQDGSSIAAGSFSGGSSGSLFIDSDVVQVSGVKNPSVRSNINSSTLISGTGGDVNITARQLLIEGGASVLALNTGEGASGNLVLNISEIIRLQGVGPLVPTEIAANLDLFPPETRQLFGLPDFPTGTAGSLTINTPTLEILDGARVAALNSGVGNAGELQINADSILLDNGGNISATTNVGQGGNINLQVQELAIGNQGFISTTAESSGNAGTVTIGADRIRLRNASSITASAPQGSGGNIVLNVGDFLDARSSSFISATAGGEGLTGGNINITGPNLIYLQASDITASATGTANGGNIALESNFLVGVGGSDSDIIARAEAGQGGNIDIVANGIFGLQFREQLTPSNDINASSDFGVSGTVSITGNIAPAQGLSPLPGLRDITKQIGGICDGANHQGSFFVAGRGGIAPDPRQFLRQQTPLQDFRVALAVPGTPTTGAKQADNQRQLSVLLAKGKTDYDAGQWQQARNRWRRALTLAQDQNWIQDQITSHHYLAILHQTLSQWETASGHLDQAQTLLGANPNPFLQAQLQNTEANQLFQTGQFATAFNHWQGAEARYRELDDRHGILLSQINQVQTLQALGFHHRAQAHLQQLQKHLKTTDDVQLWAITYQSLALALQTTGDLEAAQTLLETGLSLDLDDQHQAQILLHWGNTARLQQNPEQALRLYQQVTEQALEPIIQLQAQLNHLNLQIEQQDFTQALALIPTIQTQLSHLPPSHAQLYQQVNFAESLLQLHQQVLPVSELETSALPSLDRIIQTLTTTAHQAQTLQDPQAHTYALGQLAQAHSQIHQWSQAQHFSQQALTLAQQHQLPVAAYQWSWQLGQILEQQHRTDQALDAYRQAITHLNQVRQDLSVVSSDRQFSFRDQVEPLYRQVVALLLETEPGQSTSQSHLKEARDLIEDLQLAELNDYFQDACTTATPIVADDIDPKAAVIYPILLADRLDVIVSIAKQPLLHHSVAITPEQLQHHSDRLLRFLTSALRSGQPETIAELQEVYNWLIAPVQDTLHQAQIETLVFVADGPLRTLPLTALHDGERYLIETYNVALSPGLELLDPKPLPHEDLRLLVGGVSEARDNFAALPFVAQEIEEITQIMPNHRTYFNENLTRRNLQADQEPSTLIHLATHGEFGSKAEETFILLWDQRLNMGDLSRLLETKSTDQDPVELLVLSACKTATGNSRSVLGIAGMAVRSNARSVLAGLWPLNDQATAVFMAHFYRVLAQPGVTKSQAMRQALLALMVDERFDTPFYWSPYVLVGNWL